MTFIYNVDVVNIEMFVHLHFHTLSTDEHNIFMNLKLCKYDCRLYLMCYNNFHDIVCECAEQYALTKIITEHRNITWQYKKSY